MRRPKIGRLIVTLVILLGSLASVTWRQSRAFETLAALEEVGRSTSEAQAEELDLHRTIQQLESRRRVVAEARDRLGMHTPAASELVILPGGVSP